MVEYSYVGGVNESRVVIVAWGGVVIAEYVVGCGVALSSGSLF